MTASSQIAVRVFAAPDASCAHGATWSTATRLIGEHLRQRFGDTLLVEHIEVFSPGSFEFPEVLAAVRDGAQLPVVLVNDRMVSRGGKLSERIIAQAIASLLSPEVQPRARHT